MMFLFAISMAAGLSAGNASRYGYAGDQFDKVGSFACQSSLQARYGGREWQKMRDHGVAHRTLPCGTPIGVCNPRTNRCTSAFVVDRGPWGALDRKGAWHARIPPLRPGEHYRGELDLLPSIYTAIALTGIEQVVYWSFPRTEPVPPLRKVPPPRLRAAVRSLFAVNLTHGDSAAAVRGEKR